MPPLPMSSGELTPSSTMTAVGVAMAQSWLQPSPSAEASLTSMVLVVVLVDGGDPAAADDAVGGRVEARLDQRREAAQSDLAVERAELVREVMDDASGS